MAAPQGRYCPLRNRRATRVPNRRTDSSTLHTITLPTGVHEHAVKFDAYLKDEVLRLDWHHAVVIEYADAVEAALALFTLYGEEPLPLLVNITGIAAVTKEARTGMNAYRAYSRVAIVGDNPMGSILSAFSYRSLTPTRYFTSETSALRWLLRRSPR